MRTTMDIDDDILAFARARAEREHLSIGKVLSTLARTALQSAEINTTGRRNGLPTLPVTRNTPPVTLERVNQLRDDLSA